MRAAPPLNMDDRRTSFLVLSIDTSQRYGGERDIPLHCMYLHKCVLGYNRQVTGLMPFEGIPRGNSGSVAHNFRNRLQGSLDCSSWPWYMIRLRWE